MDTQSYYQRAIAFAAQKHVEQGQNIPGTDLPYVVHLSNVAMEILLAAPNAPEFDLDFAVQLALLHDVLEDTHTSVEELQAQFGKAIAEGVMALTKNNTLPKATRMSDSLNRINKMPKEVWAVKLADRITNLQVPPPHWDNAKKREYLQEAKSIASALQGGNRYLVHRLHQKIQEYNRYIDPLS